MENPEIPRHKLKSFADTQYKIPFLKVLHYPIDAENITIENRETYPIIDYISPNRRDFYKIFHMTSGTGILTIGLHQYEMGPNEIAFLHPNEIMSWQTTSEETGGHFCLVNSKYFEFEGDHVLQLLRHFPHLDSSKAVVQLNEDQSKAIDGFFSTMHQEHLGENDDKKQAILINLQMILLEIQRAGKNLKVNRVNENYSYIHDFLFLLENSFHNIEPDKKINLKTATEFAEQLKIHPNYLNSLIKEQTGKTVREHIQERLLYEAKTLLLQTDWEISKISYRLGFSGNAAFTSFFKKKEKLSPSNFRKNNHH